MKLKFLTLIALLNFSLVFSQNDKTITLTVSAQGQTISEAKQNALRDAIEQAFGTFISSNTEILNDELLKDEIRRTKAQLEANFVFEQDQISTQSYYLGMLQTVGLGIDKMFNYVDKMNEIETKDLSNVANLYLNFDQINTVELLPQGI